MSALAERIIAARDDMKRHFASHYVLSVMADAANALSSERERAERAERERDEARGVVRDTLWMARRYADGRQSYAVGMYNDAAKIAEAGGYAKGEPDGTLYALDGLRPEYQTLETRAQAAEAKVKEAGELLDAFGRMLNEDHDNLPDELVVSLTYDDTAYDGDLGGPNTLLGELFLRVFRNARSAALRWTQGEGE